MVALLKNGLTDERQELVHERFLAMLPRIRRQALVAFRDRGRKARQELAAEVVANAFCRLYPARSSRQTRSGVRNALGPVCNPPGL